MQASRFLIMGANGQLGTALKQKYSQAQAADVAELDITNADSVNKYNWNDVDVILNAAAYTNVDGAETDEGRVAAWQVNAKGAANLARAAIEHNLILVHTSTEYVFDGKKTSHREDEPFSPLSVYGASKAAGDAAVALVPKHYILRTSWLIGEGKNFVRTMLELGQKGTTPTVVTDQIGRPTLTKELARAIDHLLKTRSAFGIYNVTNDGPPVSWADFTRRIFKEAGFELEVTNTTTAEYFASKPDAAPRPLNSVLDLTKIRATGFKLTDWREDLREYIKKETRK